MSVYRFSHYLTHISRHLPQGVILHYDSASRGLRGWAWPINAAGERVTPDDLSNFRITHDLRAPCCLCACQGLEGYTESALFIGDDGPNLGKYMAGCASNKCGYLICMEKMYSEIGLLIRKYPLRPAGTLAPMPILYLPRNNTGNAAPIQRPTRGASSLLNVSIPVCRRRPIGRPSTFTERFLKLDSWGRAGLRESEFKKLFVKCVCGLVMTCRVFQDHDCAVTMIPHTVIDLTSDSNDAPVIIDLTNED